MIADTVPLSKPMPWSRRWWNKNLQHQRKENRWLNEYQDKIKKVKNTHWIDWLKNTSEQNKSTANRYISEPESNGSKTYIPQLEMPQPDSAPTMAVMNEEKTHVLKRTFLPPPPAMPSDFSNVEYQMLLPNVPEIKETQITRQAARLSSYKASGPDHIPNIVIQQSIRQPTLHLDGVTTTT
jgi:hypothetical protein